MTNLLDAPVTSVSQKSVCQEPWCINWQKKTGTLCDPFALFLAVQETITWAGTTVLQSRGCCIDVLC